MITCGTSQPQVVLSLGQLANISSSARSASQAGRSSSKRHVRNISVAASKRFKLPQMINENLRYLTSIWIPARFADISGHDSQRTRDQSTSGANSIGKLELEANLEVPPDLLGNFKPVQNTFTSTSSFFENCNGFTEKELSESTYYNRPNYNIQLPFPHFLKLQPELVMQNTIRGIKTHRSNDYVGFGALGERRGIITKYWKRINNSEETKHKLDEQMNAEHLKGDERKLYGLGFLDGFKAKGPESENSNKKKQMGRFVLTGLLIGLGVYFVFGKMSGILSGGVKLSIVGGGYEAVNPEDINTSFDDVKGCDEAKQELQDVVEFLKNPDRFTDLGAKLPKGVLLVGAPGIGKTLLARAVAGEAVVPFFHASGSEFDEMFVGTGAKRIRSLFEAAKGQSPCVIFIDEIDSVGGKRTSSSLHPYANQTINQLLTEMDGFHSNTGVIVIGATNKKGNLDSALLRPGRFDVEVQIRMPDLKGRIEILEHYMAKIKYSPTNVNIEKIARCTTGCSGADLENIVNQAALKAALDQAPVVDTTHLEYALDKITMGIEKKTRIPDKEVNTNTAYHEAGHAIVAYLTKDAIPVRKITIMPRGDSLGHTSMVPENDVYGHTKSQLLARLDMLMGGRVAEELVFGHDKVTTGASNDLERSTQIATAMVKDYGMSDIVGVRVFPESSRNLSSNMTELIDVEIKRLLQESYKRAEALLKTHHKELKDLSLALLKYETLDSKDLDLIMKGKPIKKTISTAKKNQYDLNIEKTIKSNT